MTLLPSPIPHPLDYSPWDLPGWMYDALDWVVGVEWPDGDERAVWDLADQWYAVAALLTGPQADAVAAATEVRNGYGGVGAVAAAFDDAWRRVAEGDDAPLPVLLTVSTDLGRLVEECGCDIEGAKLEVWIELGILVVELLGLAVATVLTAGAASPAAAAAITATRVIVQQIFKRLMAQLARKTLRHGLKEAGERAAKQVAEGGVRGLARRAAVGGLYEAGEEAGVTLATQAYQNSTGRRDGLDLTDVGTSAVGGLAGGAVAPLAGLGRHATGRGARIGEHVAREMTGEVLAEQAASLATGRGLTSVEDAARAAVSGARGSATTQVDAVLQAHLDGRLSALAGTNLPPPAISSPTAPALLATDGPVAAAGGPTTGGGAAPPALGTAGGVSADALATGSAVAPTLATAGLVETAGPVTAAAGSSPAAGSVTAVGSATAVGEERLFSGTGLAESTPRAGADPFVADPSRSTGASPAPADRMPAPLDAPQPRELSAPLAGAPTLSAVVNGPLSSTGLVAADGPPVAAPHVSAAGPPVTAGTASPGPTAPVASGPNAPVSPSPSALVAPGPAVRSGTVTSPVPGPTAPVASDPVARHGVAAPPLTGPDTRHGIGFAPPVPPPPPLRPMDDPSVLGPVAPRPRTPEWYAARWAADQDAFERRGYRGHYEFQRNNHEENRRRDRAEQLRCAADRAYDEARWLLSESRRLAQAGYQAVSERFFAEGRDRERWCHRQRDLADEILAGTRAPSVVPVVGDDFDRINDDVGDLARGAVGTSDRSALTGDDHPPPIDRTRRYHVRGGLRPPLARHQRDVERQMPRRPDGTVVRTADPRVGGWFKLVNDGGPQADPTRGINCVDCTLSLFDTWVHGRPRVSAPRTFDAYALGDVTRPLNGETDGPGRIEDATGGRFQRLCEPPEGTTLREQAHALDTGYRNLRDQLILGGHGSFAFVINQWEGGGSHIWVALNQNGTILYLDPQSGEIADQPLGRHRGVPHPYNAVNADVLVLAGDGEPRPLAGLRRGLFSQRPDLPAYPPATEHQGYGEPYLNRLHLLVNPGSAEPPERFADGRAARAESGPATEPDAGQSAQQQAAAEPIGPGQATPDAPVPEADGDAQRVTAVLAAVTAAAPTADIDSALRTVAPHLDQPATANLAQVLGDERMRSMFGTIQSEPAQYQPRFAETLLRQLVGSPDLVRILSKCPELLTSLTARPLTLHHLADQPRAIQVVDDTLKEIAERGPEAVTAEGTREPQPTPLSEEQRRIHDRLPKNRQPAAQSGFDPSRMNDAEYQRAYLDRLYADAAEAQADVRALAERLGASSAFGAVADSRMSPKDRARAEDKIVEYEGDVSLLTDLAAAKVVFTKLPDLYQAVLLIIEDPTVDIVQIEDRFVDPQASGYRDMQMMLRTSNGHIAEFRLHLAALDDVADWEHSLYRVRRDLDSVSREQGRNLSVMETAIRNGIVAREQAFFWDALWSTLDEERRSD